MDGRNEESRWRRLTKSRCNLSCSTVTVCLGYRANKFVVGLSNNAPARHAPDLWDYTLCGQYPGTVYDGRTVTLQCTNVCERQLPFRYVIVQFPLTSDHMTVCEIEVYAIGMILFRYVTASCNFTLWVLGHLIDQTLGSQFFYQSIKYYRSHKSEYSSLSFHIWIHFYQFLQSLQSFLPRDAVLERYMPSSCVCMSVCLCVCHTPVLYQKPRDLSFLTPKITAKFERDHPLRGRQMQVGYRLKLSIFDE